MDAEYGRVYAQLYARHWWWRAREQIVLGEIAQIRRGLPQTRILDVGCGDGLFFDALSAYGTVDGVEPDARLVTRRDRASGTIAVAPFDERFTPPHSYGLILFLDVLEHLSDPVAALRHARTLLASDGVILITVPAFRWLWTRHDEINHHVTRFSRTEFASLAASAGLVVRADRYLFQWLVPAKLLVRGLERVRPGAATLPGVPPAILNRCLLSYSVLESRVAAKLNLSVGSSLLAVLAPR